MKRGLKPTLVDDFYSAITEHKYMRIAFYVHIRQRYRETNDPPRDTNQCSE